MTVNSYRNKWLKWTDFWFYHRVCEDAEVDRARLEGLARASPLVSQISEMRGVWQPPFLTSDADIVSLGDAYVLTSRWQISPDHVEEWPPLSSSTTFDEVVDKDGYRGPVLDVERPPRFGSDTSIVSYVEGKAS